MWGTKKSADLISDFRALVTQPSVTVVTQSKVNYQVRQGANPQRWKE
jgi:hypothetical protein